MKFWNRSALLLMLMSVILAACSGSPLESATAAATQAPTASPAPTAGPTPEPVDIRWHSFFGGPTQANYEESLADSLPLSGVPVRIQHDSTALYAEPIPLDELNQVLANEPPPDVVSGFIGGAALNGRTRQGEIAKLDQLWQEMGWHDVFPESVIEMAAVDGSQYYLPHAVQWNPIWYRADLFNELDLEPPETWDELLELCQNLRSEDIVPFTVSETVWTPPLARWFTILNLRINGPEFHQSLMAGEIAFDDPRVRAVFEHWLEMFEAGCFEDASSDINYGRAIYRFSRGEAAMYNLGEWIYESLTPGVIDKIDFFRFPVIDPSVPNGEIASVYGSYSPMDASHPEAARLFLGHLGSVDAQQSVVEEVGRLVPDRRIDQSVVPAYQQKGMTFLEGSGQLVTLFEFNVFSEAMAEAGLQAFSDFYNARSDESIDPILGDLEATRLELLNGN